MSTSHNPWKTRLDYDLGYLIHRASSALKLAMQRAFKEHGLTITPVQWSILQKLSENKCLSQVELATLLVKDRPNITRIIDVMEKSALVVREADPNDRRKYMIYLTDKGREAWEVARSISLSIREKVLLDIPEEELGRLREQIIQITQNLE